MNRTFGSAVELMLRAALADGVPATDAARRFLAEFEPDASLDVRAYAAIPAVYTRLKEGTPNDPHWTLFAGVTRQAWTRNHVFISAARSAFDALERVDANPIVLPGALTAMAALGDSRARVLDRIEVVIASAYIPRAVAALLAVGMTIREDPAPLLEGRAPLHTTVHAELAGGTLVVRSDHPTVGSAITKGLRAGPEDLHVASFRFSGLSPECAFLAVLADLTDSDPSSVRWTNLVLELGRLRRLLDARGAGFGAVARVAHDADRHDVWGEQLRMLAYLSGDRGDAAAADRFAAVAPPPAPPPGRARATLRRSAPGRAVRMLRQYRTTAAGRDEPVTLRGLARFLEGRWQLATLRDLPRAVGRRILRARRPQAPAVSSASSSASSISRTSNE